MSSPTRSKSRKPPSSPLPPKSPSGSYPVNKSRSPESHAEFIKTELHYILSHDDPQNIPIPPNSTRYIITTRFLTTWLNYTVYNSLLPPLNIDNTDLLHLQTLNKTKTLTVKPNLENNIHYRHVNEATWNTYARYYPDSGPAIRVPYKTVSDNKTWTIVETRLGIAKIKKKEKVIKRRGGGGGKHKGDGTLRATWLDKDDLVFNNDNHENINTALALSEALGKDAGGTDAGAADPALDHVLPRAWTSLYVQYLLGVTPSHPGPLDNVVLLVQQETLMGPTWSRCPTTLPPGEGEKLLFVQKQTFDQIVKSMKSSGPRIVRNTGGSAPSDGESAPTAASSPSRRASLAYRWNIDENFMLRKHMNMAVEAVPERSHAESAVVHFMNPMSSKKIGEIEARDKEMEREQKEQEAVAAAALFTGGLEQRRKSMAAEAAEEHKALIIEQTKLLMGGGTKLRSMSADGEAEEVSQEVLEERAADIICRFLLMKTIEHRKRLAKAKADRAYEEWAAMKFQSCWRTRKARRKVAAIKEEREKMKRDISALRVEAVWRTYQAKKAMRARKEDKEVDGAAKFISKVWRGRQAKKEFKGKLGAAGLLVRLARRQIDSRKTAEMRRELGKVPMRVKVVSASGVGGQESVWDGDVESRRSSFNPFHSPKSGTKSKGPNTRVYVSGFENTSMTATGLTKTSVKKGSGNPLYDETLIVGGDNFNGNGTLVLTVCEHSTLGTHKFLGQAVVNLKDVIETSFFKQGGAEGESVVLEGVGLGRYKFPIPDYDGRKAMKIDGTENAGVGAISLEFLPLNVVGNVCGWMSVRGVEGGELVGGLAGQFGAIFNGKKGAEKWELRYCVLCEGVLSVYQGPYRLNSSLWTCEKGEVAELRVEEKESEVSKRNRVSVGARGEEGGETGGGETVKVREIVVQTKAGTVVRLRSVEGTGGAGCNWKSDESAWIWKLQQALGKKGT